jgi:hypothetical protein
MRRGNIEIVIIMTLLSVTLFTIILILQAQKRVFDDQTKYGACADQIKAHASIVSFTNGVASPGITCPTNHIAKEVVDQDEAKKVLADQMARCWREWGEGKYKLFGGQEGLFCHVCSIVDLQGVEKLEGFPSYLDTHKANEDLNYGQYLTGTNSGGYFTGAQFQNQAEDQFLTDKPVAVIFTYSKGLGWDAKLWNKIKPSPTTSTLGGAALGILALGSVAISGGLSTPVVIAAGTTGGAMGGGLGLYAGISSTAETDYRSMVVIRSMDPRLKDLGCTGDFAANS